MSRLIPSVLSHASRFACLALLLAGCHQEVSKLADDPTPTPTVPTGGTDLVVAFEGQPQVTGNSIHFVLKVSNIGLPMPGEAKVGIKAFLIRQEDYATKIAGQGIVLETVVPTMQLASQGSTVVDLVQALPVVPEGKYFLGATINTMASLYAPPESWDDEGDPNPQPTAADPVKEDYKAQLNNVTASMADLGAVSNAVAIERHGKYDLYHEVENATIRLQSGTASHSSRNILRVMEGADELPDESNWDTEISARFLFIDLAAGKLSLGGYTKRSVDKIWTAISFGHERDLAGRDIHVDYYSNDPIVSNLAPGAYVLGVLMNVNDAFKLDSYPENNLDLTYMSLSAESVMKVQKEVWIPATSPSKRLRASISDRADLHQWSFDVPNKPAWLDVVALPANPYSYGLKVTGDSAAAPLGLTEIPITIIATKDGVVTKATSTVKFYKNSGPVLQLAGVPEEPAGLGAVGGHIDDVAGTKVLIFGVTVKSAGTDRLFYSATSSQLQIVANGSGTLESGTSTVIGFRIPLLGFAIPAGHDKPSVNVSFNIESNAGSYPVDFSICFDPTNFSALDVNCSGGNGGDDDR